MRFKLKQEWEVCILISKYWMSNILIIKVMVLAIIKTPKIYNGSETSFFHKILKGISDWCGVLQVIIQGPSFLSSWGSFFSNSWHLWHLELPPVQPFRKGNVYGEQGMAGFHVPGMEGMHPLLLPFHWWECKCPGNEHLPGVAFSCGW